MTSKTTLVCSILILLLLLVVGQISADSIPDSTELVNDTIVEAISSGVIDQQSEASVYPLSAERKEKLNSYSSFRNIWRFADFFISLGLLALLLFSGINSWMRKIAAKVKIKFFSLWLYLILFSLIYFIVDLPFAIYRGYMVEGDYGFLNQSFGAWFFDEIKGLLILLVIGIIPVFFFYFLVERFKRWWLIFSIGSLPFMVFFVVIAPVFISPLFNDFVPLEDQQLKSKILSLAETAGIEGSNVFQVDASKQSSKINAYVTGMFGSKRIVLYDTMIDNFEEDEILYVMGHEMGHYVMNHLWYGILLSVVFVGFMLWLADKTLPGIIKKISRRSGISKMADMASLPLVLIFLTIVSFVFQPVSNGYSRYMEHQSDIYGMEITDVSGESAAIAFDKLGAYNLADPEPHPLVEFWFYSHPALAKRMDFVRKYERTQ